MTIKKPILVLSSFDGLPSAGVQMIDDDHRMIIALYNHFVSTLCETPECPGSIRLFIYDLRAHAKAHFCREEMVMEAIGYNHLNEHKRGHDAFLHRLETLAHESSDGGVDGAGLADFTHTWITEHIRGDDADLSRFIRTPRDPRSVNDMIVFSVLV